MKAIVQPLRHPFDGLHNLALLRIRFRIDGQRQSASLIHREGELDSGDFPELERDGRRRKCRRNVARHVDGNGLLASLYRADDLQLSDRKFNRLALLPA